MPDHSTPVLARPDDAPLLPAPIDDRPAFLVRDKPLIDSVPARWIEYLHATVAIAEDPKQHPITRGEIGVFIELCARYMLDPFAKEAWLAKSKRGKLLTMVGRDGLRKIAQRNGLHVDGDVVHEGDTFKVSRTPDGNRTVTHEYAVTGDRGRILGAWAEVRDGGPLGKPMGFFWAPLGEYKPANTSEYSVWAKQTSVMILGAAERTAVRQATPLSGLVAFGEHESAFARASLGEGVGGGAALNIELPAEVEAVIKRATDLGHAGLSDRETVGMLVDGQPPERVAVLVREWTAELDAIPVDAEVVSPDALSGDLSGEAAQTTEHPQEAQSAPQEPAAAAAGEVGEYAPPTPDEQAAADKLGQAIVSQGFLDDGPPRKAEPRPDPERIAALRERANDLLYEADELRDSRDPREAEVREEAERLQAEVEAADDPAQARWSL